MPVADDSAMVGELVARVSGFGPLQPFLDDPEVEEVWINDPSRVFIARRGRSELTTTILGAGELADLVERMLRTSGRRIDMSTPFVDAMLPDGSRLHVVIPDMIRTASPTCADRPQQLSDLQKWCLSWWTVNGLGRTSCGLAAD